MITAHTPPFQSVDYNDSITNIPRPTKTLDDYFKSSDYDIATTNPATTTTSPEKPEKKEWVNHPSHYNQGGIECIEAIKAACTGLDGFEGFLTGTALRYLWRWRHKENPVQDCNKAIWYLNELIKYETKKGEA